jgi:hypothetical protein
MEVMFYFTMCLTFLQSKMKAFNYVSNLYLHTRCIKNTWWFLKFENQHAHLVVLPYRRSSRTVMLRSTGQCSNALQQWNCLSKQSVLQLYSMVSDSSFSDVLHLAIILCYCWNLNGFMKDQWRIIIQMGIQVLLVHLTMVPMSLKMWTV